MELLGTARQVLPSFKLSAIAILAITCLSIVSWVLYQRCLSPLKDIPGPWLASVTRYWQFGKTLNGYWHEEIVKLHDKYGRSSFPIVVKYNSCIRGEVVRIAPNEVSFTTPDVLKKAYAHTGAPFVKVPTCRGLRLIFRLTNFRVIGTTHGITTRFGNGLTLSLPLLTSS
jgi:hypothetical protein